MNHFMRIFLVAAAGVNLTAHAQQSLHNVKDIVGGSWEIAMPSDNNFLSKTSLGGWRFEYRKMVGHDVSLGLAISGNAFDEHFPTKTYSKGATAVTTDMVRQMYTLPMTVIAHYYFNTNSKLLQPYIGAGIGAQYTELHAYYNIYLSTDNRWAFVARPEVGTFISFGPSPTKGMISFGYNVAYTSSDALDIDHLKQFTLNIGLVGIK